MKTAENYKFKGKQLARPVLVSVAIILFMYFAGEAAGEFFYNITH